MTKKLPRKTIKLSIFVSLATVAGAAAADAATEEQLARYQCKPVEGRITRSSICIDRGMPGEGVRLTKRDSKEQP